MDTTNKDRLLLGLPKKGRLYEPILLRLSQAGYNFKRSKRSDFAICEGNKKIVAFYLPAREIAKFVADGLIDLGITGEDVVKESGFNLTTLLKFEFGTCRLCVQLPQNSSLKIKDLAGRRVATSFPNIARQYFLDHKLDPAPKVVEMSGSVEMACRLGLADALIDLVDSGETMQNAELKILDQILYSQALLIKSNPTKHENLIDIIVRRLTGVETAIQHSIIEYNICKDNLKQAVQITPGSKSPTIMNLEDSGWVAVKALVRRAEINLVLDKLQELGATAILVYRLESCRF